MPASLAGGWVRTENDHSEHGGTRRNTEEEKERKRAEEERKRWHIIRHSSVNLCFLRLLCGSSRISYGERTLL
jgi:hypothetical protein